MEQAEKQLSKLGGTIYDFGGISGKIGGGLMLPASAFNELRRLACEALDALRIEKNTVRKGFSEIAFPPKKVPERLEGFRLELSTASQLDGLDLSEIDFVTLPIFEAEKLQNFAQKDKIILTLPRYTKDENAIVSALKNAVGNGFRHIECQNPSHIKIGQALALEMHGGFGLNVTNSFALDSLKRLGLRDCVASFEMKLSQLSQLSAEIPFGIIAFGQLPLMLTVNCPIKQAVGCANCTHFLFDRTRRSFPVVCKGDSVEILNAETLYMADRLNEIKRASFITLQFSSVNSVGITAVIE